jgi:hypothetical protein
VRLDWLHRLTEHPGPFATVVTDASRDGEDADHTVELRWRAHAARLAGLGAPDSVVRSLAPVVCSPTRRGGEVGRVVVASADGVLLDQVLPEPPLEERTSWGPVPDLVPVVRALSRSTSYVLAEVDSSGADVQAVSARGDELEAATVVGDHDVLHKVPGGGWSHRRYQMRVQDSVQHNAAEVADQLVSEVRRYKPDVVLVAGTETPVTALLQQVPPLVAERVVRLHTGGRAAGTDSAALAEEVSRVLDERCRTRDEEVLDRFARGRAVQREGVAGLDAVVAAFQRDQVDELLVEDRDLDHPVWVSARPDQLATSTDDLDAIGVPERAQARADAALVWAAIGTGAGVTVVPADRTDDLTDGVGALLRWVDDSTAHDRAVAVPGHGEG